MHAKNIELRILPLVKAINETGLFRTFSSCEGHFGHHDPDNFTDMENANVSFDPVEGISEDRIESFFARVFADHRNSQTKWEATLSICKYYVPSEEGRLPIQYHYRFEIHPFNPYESNEEKRRHVDILIEEVTNNVRRHS